MAEAKNVQKISITNGTIFRAILIIGLIAALYYLSDLVLVILTAIVLASFVQAAVNRLGRLNVNRALSVVIIYLLTLAIMAGIFYLFVPVLVKESSNLLTLLSKYLPRNNALLNNGTFTDARNIVTTLSNPSYSGFFADTKSFVTLVSGGFLQSVAGLFGGLFNFILILVISFYLSIQEKGIEKFLKIVTPMANEEYVVDLWQRTERKIALWIKGQLILGIIIGVLVYFGLLLIGVQYAVILALAAAFFELIPFGIILATVPAVSFAYIEGGLSLALFVLVFYVVIQQLENYLIQPLVVRRVIGISPLVVILSVLIGAKLAGFWGLILAVPVAVALLEFMDDVEKKKVSLREG